MKHTRSETILFAVNEAAFFISHRLPLAERARQLGFDVVVVCGAGTGEEALQELGIRYRTITLSRSGFNPYQEWHSYRQLRRIYRLESPRLVHQVTIKPVIYGTRVARSLGIPCVVNAIPGMGFVFTRRGPIADLRRRTVNILYRIALRHPNMKVIFQNRDDMESFTRNEIVTREQSILIRGSGVELSNFENAPEPEGPIVFLLVARMLKDKGVREFVRAARQVRRRYPTWRFLLVGDVDPGNPSSLSQETIEKWQSSGVVEWLGQRKDIADLMNNSHVVCLPSYREGLPKTLLEAAAAGRPMIATDVSGCREVVRDGVTGCLVPPRDVRALVEAMVALGTDETRRARMGSAARERAENLFSIEDVVQDTFLIYQELMLE